VKPTHVDKIKKPDKIRKPDTTTPKPDVKPEKGNGKGSAKPLIETDI